MREIRFSVRQTGYDSEDTTFLVTVKDKGTSPDIKVYQSGPYQGELTLSHRGAEELVRTLRVLIGHQFKD